MILSWRSLVPVIASLTVAVGLYPINKCALANPKSASRKVTFEPIDAIVKARLTAMLVLPTPPLPLATEIEIGMIKISLLIIDTGLTLF